METPFKTSSIELVFYFLTGDAEKKRLKWVKMVSGFEEKSALHIAKKEGKKR